MRVLKNSGSEDFKSVLTFQNWWKITGDIGCQSCLPLNSAIVHIVNPVTKSLILSTFIAQILVLVTHLGPQSCLEW